MIKAEVPPAQDAKRSLRSQGPHHQEAIVGQEPAGLSQVLRRAVRCSRTWKKAITLKPAAGRSSSGSSPKITSTPRRSRAAAAAVRTPGCRSPAPLPVEAGGPAAAATSGTGLVRGPGQGGNGAGLRRAMARSRAEEPIHPSAR